MGEKAAAPPLSSCGRRWAGAVLLIGGVAEDTTGPAVLNRRRD